MSTFQKYHSVFGKKDLINTLLKFKTGSFLIEENTDYYQVIITFRNIKWWMLKRKWNIKKCIKFIHLYLPPNNYLFIKN
jgi:hypothetical protein